MSRLTDVDAFINNAREGFRAAQISHFEEFGRYWQGPFTHTTVPTISAVPTAADTPAQEGLKTWRDMLPGLANLKLTFRASCDEYDSSEGKGYQLRVEAVQLGVTYTKVFNFGPLQVDSAWKPLPKRPA